MGNGIVINRRQPFKEELERLLALLDVVQEECGRTPNPWFGRAPLGSLQLRLLDRVRKLYEEVPCK